MSILNRVPFDCPVCEKTFYRTINKSQQANLLLTCPHCDSEFEIDFKPERSNIVSVRKRIT